MNTSIFDAANDRADQLAGLGWLVVIGFSAVSVIMCVLIVWAALRRRGSFDSHMPVGLQDGRAWLIVGGVVIPALTFAGLLAVSIARMHTAAPEPHHMSGDIKADIRVTGHRWWWQVEYLGDSPWQQITSANEIHIPVGRDVIVELTSADVIHSFWVPRLQGKVDLIPGHVTHIVIRADDPGRYDGQCGEYCGEQHARMRLVVIAHPPADYDTWRIHEAMPANLPHDAVARRGRGVFEARACALCHTIRGTRGQGRIGPDLTHFGERRRIAANAYPQGPGFLSAWMVHAQALKPGSEMPDLAVLSGDELEALRVYLEGLR